MPTPLSVCPASRLLSDYIVKVFSCKTTLYSNFSSSSLVKTIGLIVRKTLEPSDFSHLQFSEPTGILDEGLTPNKKDCFFPQMTGLQRREQIYMHREGRRRLSRVGGRREGKLGTEWACYFSSFTSKIPANMLAVPSGIRDIFDYV